MNRDAVKNIMATNLALPFSSFQNEEVILTDLVQESFMLIELVIELQEQLKIRLHQEDLADVKTLRNLLDMVEKKQKEV